MNKHNMKDKKQEQFDYVIIGAGPSAMGLLYGLLEPYKNKQQGGGVIPSIAIVERGSGPPHDPTTVTPSNWYEAANTESSRSVSIIHTEIAGRAMKLPVGKGLGGTSNVNAGLCTAPLQQDLNMWPEPWKSSLWSYIETIRKLIEKSGMLHYAGDDKDINNLSDVPSAYRENSPIDLTAKVPVLAKQQEKGGHFERRNYYDAIIKPFFTENPHLKENVHWIQGVEAQRLLRTEKKRIYGVECYCSETDRLWNLEANREIFLCAGAIETPALLLVSGIKLGGLGKHLQDQLMVPRICISPWQRNDSHSLNGVAAQGQMFVAKNVFQVLVFDAAANASILPNVPAIVLRRADNPLSTYLLNRYIRMSCDILFGILTVTIRLLIMYSPIGYILHHFTAVSNLCLMHPYSEGEIRVVPKNKNQKAGEMGRRHVDVRVDVGYFRDSRDYETLRAGSKTLNGMVRFFEIVPGFALHQLKIFGIDWFRFYCNMLALPYYHFAGTCRMQTEDMSDSVVDKNLKLHDVDGVYVCDASVFPAMLSSPPALTCASLGYALGQSFATT